MTITEEWNERTSLDPVNEIQLSNAVTEIFDDAAKNQPIDSIADDVVGTGAFETEATWELDAACRAIDGSAELFFSEELTEIAAAKQICAECPVIAPCLEGAIRRAEPCGVWGGQLFLNGRVIAQKRRRGRPPKVARPEDQLPVVPVPEHLQKLIA